MEDTAEPTAAEKLLASRRAVYGDRIDNMVRTAQVWSGLTGLDIQPWQVPLMMSAYKMFRVFVTPDYSDNVDDIDGWNLIFREVVGDEMVNARTVEEYLAEKARRVQELLPKADTPAEPSTRKKANETPHWFKSQAQSEGEAIDRYQRAQDDGPQSAPPFLPDDV